MAVFDIRARLAGRPIAYLIGFASNKCTENVCRSVSRVMTNFHTADCPVRKVYILIDFCINIGTNTILIITVGRFFINPVFTVCCQIQIKLKFVGTSAYTDIMAIDGRYIFDRFIIPICVGMSPRIFAIFE